MLKIRLRRMGAIRQPHYRVVVADARAPRDGAFIENLGHYNPLTNPATIQIDIAKYEDAYLGKLQDLIETKRGEQQVAVPEEVDESSTPVINLMDALRRSVAQSGGARSGKEHKTAKQSRRGSRRRAS